MDNVREAIGIIPRPVSKALGKRDLDRASVDDRYKTVLSDAEQKTQ